MTLDRVDTLMRVMEAVANRGFQKFTQMSRSAKRKRLHPDLMNRVIEEERLGKVFGQKRYNGLNGKGVELMPLEVGRGEQAFLFMPWWAPRPDGQVHFKVYIVAAKVSGKESITVRFEEPENRGPNHRYWHAQLSHAPGSAVTQGAAGGIAYKCWLPTKNPAIPLPSCGDQVDLLLSMMISVYGYKAIVLDVIGDCGFEPALNRRVVERVSWLAGDR